MEIQHFKNESIAWLDFAFQPTNHKYELMISKSALSDSWEVTTGGSVRSYGSFLRAFKAARERFKWMKGSNL